MFRRKNKERSIEGVTSVCGFKDSQGEFWETYEKAVESTQKHRKVQEEREMVIEVVDYLARGERLRYDLMSIFREHSKEIYDILHKHYGKEGETQ